MQNIEEGCGANLEAVLRRKPEPGNLISSTTIWSRMESSLQEGSEQCPKRIPPGKKIPDKGELHKGGKGDLQFRK